MAWEPILYGSRRGLKVVRSHKSRTSSVFVALTDLLKVPICSTLKHFNCPEDASVLPLNPTLIAV